MISSDVASPVSFVLEFLPERVPLRSCHTSSTFARLIPGGHQDILTKINRPSASRKRSFSFRVPYEAPFPGPHRAFPLSPKIGPPRMKFPTCCQFCGHANHVELSQVGKEIGCEGCRRTFKVPAPKETVQSASGTPEPLRFACPGCGRKYATKPTLAGKKIRCNGCGAGVRVPGWDPVLVSQPSRPALKTFGVDDIPANAARPVARQKAPALGLSESVHEMVDPSSLLDDLASIEGVKAPKRVSAVLPSRAEALELARLKAEEQQVVEAQKEEVKVKKKKKKKKRSSTFDPKETLNLMAGVGAFVAVLALLAWRFAELRFPIGGLLCVIGFIVYLMGSASLRQLVAEEGAFKVVLFRFFPPYQWWFVITHWADAKDFVAFFGAGLVILAIGGGVIKTSPIGVKAEASERAYQKARQGNQEVAPPAFPSGLDDGN